MRRSSFFFRCLQGAFVASVCLAFHAEASTILYYRFDGTVGNSTNGTGTILDSSGNGFNGNAAGVSGGSAPVYSSDRPGDIITDGLNGAVITTTNLTSLKFNNTNGTISGGGGQITVQDPLSNDSAFEPISFTIEAFVKIEDQIAFATIIGKNRADSGSSWLLDTNAGDTLRVRTDHQALGTSGGTAPGYNQGILSTNATNPNSLLGNWHHIAATYDQTTQRFTLYVDYKPVTSGSGALASGILAMVYDDNPILIGQGSGGRAFDGWIDEIRYSDTVLTSDQFLRAVPEPGSLALLALGAGAFAARRRRAAR